LLLPLFGIFNPFLSVSLDCPFLIAPHILYTSLDCPFLIAPHILYTSLDCPFLIAQRNGGLNQILKRQTSRFDYGSNVPAVTGVFRNHELKKDIGYTRHKKLKKDEQHWILSPGHRTTYNISVPVCL
jgi:hypothetical protein